MSVLARIIVALIVGPGVGAIAGQELAHAATMRAGLEAGVTARAEMSGLLIGALVGIVFAILAIRSAVAFEGQLRNRIADVVLLPIGALLALSLLAGQRHAPADVVAVIRWTMVGAWTLAFLLLLTSLRYRPPEPVPQAEEAPETEPDAPEAQPRYDEGAWERYVSEAYDDE